MYRIVFGALVALALPGRACAADDPDALYAQRATLPKAVQPAAIWQAALDRNPSDFDAAWKRARAGYWIGGHETTRRARDAAYEAAMAAARKAIAAQPDKPEGHFWLAAIMGGYAQDHGIRGGLKYRGDIRDELETVLAIDKGVPAGIGRSRAGPLVLPGAGTLRRQQAASPKSTCGPLSPTIPAASSPGCSWPRRSRRSIGRTTPIAELRQIESLTPDPDWIPEDTEFKAQARSMLARLTGSK